MTYDDALQYLYQRLPVFHRDGKKAYKPGLETIARFCEHLGNPQNHLRTLHIAGTNGKGSTSHWLAAILQAAGYRTGLYTSPHLKSYRERIRVNGVPLEPAYVAQFVTTHQAFIETIQPSFFEVTVAMALAYFAEQRVDVAVVEVGVGGRLDSTNLISPVLAVITNIGWDHMDLLGDSLTQIAAEKAGIIKTGVPVVISEAQEEVLPVFKHKAQEVGAPLFVAEGNWFVEDQGLVLNGGRQVLVRYQSDVETHRLGLLGSYQLRNLKGVLEAIRVLRSLGWAISSEAVRQGLQAVVSLTGLKGRWQVLQSHPLIIADTAHNEAGLREVLSAFQQQVRGGRWFIIGFVRDKSLERILPLLPRGGKYIACQANNPRFLPAEALEISLQQAGLTVARVCANVNEALDWLRPHLKPEEGCLITGSTYLVGELNEV